MNVSKRGRLNQSRLTREFRLAPTARAIRAALAISATVLALSGSGGALAGTCVSTAENTMACNGDFLETVPGSIFLPTVDLTLVLGDSAPTSVTPGAGALGIDATWDGSVSVTSYADITTDGADGVHVYATGSANFFNFGAVDTQVSADGAQALDIGAYGDVTVVNGGDILAIGNGPYDVTAVTAYATYGSVGSVSITNQAAGSITATASNGDAVAVEAYVFAGRATVINDGDIAASSVNGHATGVHAQASAEVVATYHPEYCDYYGICTEPYTTRQFVAGTALVINNNSIQATSDSGQAVGVYAGGSVGRAVVFNYGDVSAVGDTLAIGMVAAGESGAYVRNTGSVLASANHAIGIDFSVVTGTGSFSNLGLITVIATEGDAKGVSVDSLFGDNTRLVNYAAGAITVSGANAATGMAESGLTSLIVNLGDLTVSADSGVATGIVAHDVVATVINNAGTIEVVSNWSSALGIDTAGATAYNVSIVNYETGAILVRGGDAATGVLASSSYYSGLLNLGTITATAGTGDAIGVFAEVYGGPRTFYASVLDNAGIIAASSAYGNATGIWSESDRADSVVDNGGAIIATAVNGVATGIRIDTQRYAIARAINSGSIEVSGYQADGIRVHGYAGGAYADNSGDITVAATAVLARASGIYAESGSDPAWVDNSGSISVTVGLADATGIVAYAPQDSVAVTNSGDITVHSNIDQVPYVVGTYTYASRDYAVGIVARGEQEVTVINAGTITAQATFHGQGIEAFSADTLVSVTNSAGGTIAVTAEQYAWGIEALSVYGDVAVNNMGAIVVSSTDYARNPFSFGIFAGSYDDVSVVNSGSITLLGNETISLQGIIAISYMGYTDDDGLLEVVNSGDISISGAFRGTGIRATMIGVDTVGGPDYGGSLVGNVLIRNSGNINVDGSNTYGIYASGRFLVFGDDIELDNSGNLTVAGVNKAIGIYALVPRDNFTKISNSGDISVSSSYGANGVYFRDTSDFLDDSYGSLTFDNSGSISASIVRDDDFQASLYVVSATGVRLVTTDDSIMMQNSGLIAAMVEADPLGAYAFTRAFAVVLDGGRGAADIDFTNTGSITAGSISNGSTYSGLSNVAGVVVAAGYGAAKLINSGNIAATAQTDISAPAGLGSAPMSVVGIRMDSYTRQVSGAVSLGDFTVTNQATGSIMASVISNYGDISIEAAGIYAGLGTTGSALVSADHGITIDNAGAVSANALVGGVDTVGVARATGIFASSGSYGFVNVSNSGVISATATAIAAADAIGISAAAIDVTVALNAGGTVSATASGATGTATGLWVSGDQVDASNAGNIAATFVGGGDTYGALIASATGEVTFTNSGSITATDADYAVGVQLDSLYGTTLINSGAITAVSGLAGSIAVRTGASLDLISNTGTINGALVTGDGDDILDNAAGGTWNAFGTSDFGGGDDTINNGGTINLDNAFIGLGSFTAVGNSFTNTGTITVSGDANTIDMGTLNPLAFTNNGVIDFQDGAPDDMLSITGDFGGQGDINVDVSGLNLASDQLYIDGNVVSGSVSTINVDLLDLPSSLSGEIAMVSVSGDSVAGNFALGDVHFNQEMNFVTLDFDVNLISDIDTSNASADVFSLGFGVTGLSDTGTLGASIAPGAQSLMTSQIGTWRQRMGVIDKLAQGGLSLWTRFFSDQGTVNPEHTADNFGQGGNFAFDQKNSGVEIGADFAISEQFSAGVLLGKVKADQELNQGIGESTIKGDSYGIYGTWLPGNGFYLDASYRAMSFDVTVDSQGGRVQGSGQANAFNVEAGYGWTLGGMILEPQFQYTRTTVDDVDALDGVLADFQAEGGDSSRARLGVMVRKTMGEGATVWTPYLGLSAVREFDGSNAFAINDDFSGTTNVEGTSALVEGGVAVNSGNLSLFGSLNWQDGGALDSFVGGQVGVRYTW